MSVPLRGNWWGNTTSELLHFFVHVCHLEQQEVLRIMELYERLGMTSLCEFRQHVNSKILLTIGITPLSAEHILSWLEKTSTEQESLQVKCAKSSPLTTDGFYIETPTPNDAKTPEAFFERAPARFMGVEEFAQDVARDHLGSPLLHAPDRIELVGSELMLAEEIESMTEPAPPQKPARSQHPRRSHWQQQQQKQKQQQQLQQQQHVSIGYSSGPSDAPPPLRDRFQVQQCAFDSFPPHASPKDSPALPITLSRFKHISFPPNPCVVYHNAIKRRENWPPPSQAGGGTVLRGSSRSIYNACIERNLLRRTSSLPAFPSASLASFEILPDFVHEHQGKGQWAVHPDCPNVDCPHFGYCSFAGTECPRTSPVHNNGAPDGAPRLHLPQIKAVYHSRPQSAPKSRTPRLNACALRRVGSTCTLEEMERGECCQPPDPSLQIGQDSHSDGSEDGDDVLNLTHHSNHDPALVSEECPGPLAPSDVEVLCKPMQALMPTSRNVGLGFGWHGHSSTSSSTSTTSEVSASLSSLLSSGRVEAGKRGLESARESLSDEMSLPGAEKAVEEDDDDDDEEEEEDDEEEEEEEDDEERKQGEEQSEGPAPPAALTLPLVEHHRNQQQENQVHEQKKKQEDKQDQIPRASECGKYCQCQHCRGSLCDGKAKCTIS